MRICFIPIDNRPVCYSLAKDICAIDNDIELLMPSREWLGDLQKPADREKILDWIANLPESDSIILSLDTVIYGGLISSRRGAESLEELTDRIQKLKSVLLQKKSRIYAFSSIMRISNNNYNEEEKAYWSEWGQKIFEYSYNKHKYGEALTDVPAEVLDDYLNTRKRNFEVNKLYLDWQKNGIIDTLIFSKDDCAEYGLNVMEAKALELSGGKIKTGADEIPLVLLSRAIAREIRVYPVYTEPEYKDCVSNYEDISIEKSVLSQLELGGFKIAESCEKADLILIVNNFIKNQGELVMGWGTLPFDGEFKVPEKPYAVADVRFANGADNNFVGALLEQLEFEKFYGYAGWNTSANTLGSLLAAVKVRYTAVKYNEDAFKRLQIIRFLDDWAYQANVREKIDKICAINDLMRPYEEKISQIFKYNISPGYKYPWNRKFEIEICI